MKITSNGKVHDTLIIDDSGNPVGRVKRVTFSADVQEDVTRVIVEQCMAGLEYEGPGVIQPEGTGEADPGAATKGTLRILAHKLLEYADRDDLYNVHLHYSQSRPLCPVYGDGQDKHTGLRHSGPESLSITLFDFAKMGKNVS